MHWNRNADERQYDLPGEGRMAEFDTGPRATTKDFFPGDVGIVGKTLRHYVENIARAVAPLLLIAGTSCTGSPRTLASQPEFEVRTSAGVASVSMRQSPPGMTDEEFTQLVQEAMERAAPGSVLAGPPVAPFPLRRIVWHVDPTPSRGASRVVVNVFEGTEPYAYEQDTIAYSEPTDAMELALVSMSERLLADITDHRSQ